MRPGDDFNSESFILSHSSFRDETFYSNVYVDKFAKFLKLAVKKLIVKVLKSDQSNLSQTSSISNIIRHKMAVISIVTFSDDTYFRCNQIERDEYFDFFNCATWHDMICLLFLIFLLNMRG